MALDQRLKSHITMCKITDACQPAITVGIKLASIFWICSTLLLMLVCHQHSR